MIRARILRLGTTLTIVSLVALQVLAGTVGAADTRHLYVGPDARALDKSVPSDELVGNGTLAFTSVTAGGSSASAVYVRNMDNQTLTHVVIVIARTQGSVSISSDVFGADAGKCTSTDTAISCDFGNLKAGASRTFTLLLTTSTAGDQAITARITFNESNNPNGGNEQILSADGTLAIADGGCNLAQTFLRSGHLSPVATACSISSTNPQSTNITLSLPSDSTVTVAEEDSSACSAGLECFGQASIGDVEVDGTYTVTWTISWQVPSTFNVNKFGILHFQDGATTPDLTLTAKKDTCKTATATGCIASVSLVGTTLTAVIRTKGNGKMRGFS